MCAVRPVRRAPDPLPAGRAVEPARRDAAVSRGDRRADALRARCAAARPDGGGAAVNPALIMVDVIRAFFDDAGIHHYEEVHAVEPALERPARAGARARPRRGRTRSSATAAGLPDFEQPKLPEHCIEGDFQPEFWPGFEPAERAREIVVPKRRYSAFFATDLALIAARARHRHRRRRGGQDERLHPRDVPGRLRARLRRRRPARRDELEPSAPRRREPRGCRALLRRHALDRRGADVALSVAVLGYASADRAVCVDALPRADATAVVRRRLGEPWPRLGGCAPLIALALARADVTCSCVTWVADDDAGRLVRAGLEDGGVGTTGVAVSGARSAESFLVYEADGRSLCFFDPGDVGDDALDRRAGGGDRRRGRRLPRGREGAGHAARARRSRARGAASSGRSRRTRRRIRRRSSQRSSRAPRSSGTRAASGRSSGDGPRADALTIETHGAGGVHWRRGDRAGHRGGDADRRRRHHRRGRRARRRLARAAAARPIRQRRRGPRRRRRQPSAARVAGDPRTGGTVTNRAWYLNCEAEEVGDRAVLVGDPGRVERVAARLDDVRWLNADRGLITATGSRGDAQVTVTAFGMGAPIAAVVLRRAAPPRRAHVPAARHGDVPRADAPGRPRDRGRRDPGRGDVGGLRPARLSGRRGPRPLRGAPAFGRRRRRAVARRARRVRRRLLPRDARRARAARVRCARSRSCRARHGDVRRARDRARARRQRGLALRRDRRGARRLQARLPPSAPPRRTELVDIGLEALLAFEPAPAEEAAL